MKYNIRLCPAYFLFILIVSLLSNGGPRAIASDYVDVHMHLDGVRQKGSAQFSTAMRPGSGARMRQPMTRKVQRDTKDYLPAARSLLKLMDEYGVEKAIVMPTPQNPGQQGAYRFEELLPVVEKYPNRLILGAGGGSLNPMIHGTLASEVRDENRELFVMEARAIAQAGARAFGEMTALHVCMNPRHHYIAVSPEHPLFLLLADLAAEYDMAIDLHMEAVMASKPTPQHLMEACHKNPAMLPATIPAFERLLAHNSQARIVWQHIGWDNTEEMTIELLNNLLQKYPNLFLAIKAIPNIGEIHENRITDENFKVLPKWHAFIETFQDRIVIGADEFVNVPGAPKKPPFFKETWSMLSQFSPEVASKIGSKNARRIYKL